MQNRRIRTGRDSGFYPDLLIRCGQAADRLFEDDARVVVEVLSPSNDATDGTERLYAYQGLPSIEVILFVDHTHRLVTIHRRTGDGWDGWTESQVGAGVSRLTGELAIDWTAVWADVVAEATTE